MNSSVLLRFWCSAVALVTVFFSSPATAAGAWDLEPPAQGTRVLLVTGNDYPGHLWRQTAPALRELLIKDPRLKVRVVEDPEALASPRLQEWDVVVLHFMNWETPSPGATARENLRKFVQNGKGLVLVHFACGAWQDWPEFQKLVGRVWDPKLRGHDPHGAFRVEVADAQHPIMKGLQSFETVDELYTCLTGDTPIHVVASARSKVDGKDYPMAFVLEPGQGRVFHTVLGHDVRAITNSSVPELMRRGCAWAARLPVEPSAERPGAAAAAIQETPAPALMQARRDPESGQIDITEGAQRVLRYNYSLREPGALLQKVQPDNLKYARARSDYIHPLYGLDGQELTMDWPVDHPHHRGIYWAWPEVDYHGESGDLHALQRVFARPAGRCELQSGSGFAQINAENLWLWDDREPIVRERVVIRAFPTSKQGRRIDLEFQFVALGDDVAIARRGTEHYGGLNIRLGPVAEQQITASADPGEAKPRKAWATLSGVFASGTPVTGLIILQSQANPDYPGDWEQYPALNWLQPTFPASKTRYTLKKGTPLTLRYQLWIQRGRPAEGTCEDQWQAFQKQS